jgi:hypothetical protein
MIGAGSFGCCLEVTTLNRGMFIAKQFDKTVNFNDPYLCASVGFFILLTLLNFVS